MRTCNELGLCQSRECFDCLPGLRIIEDTAKEWGLPLHMRTLLRPVGAQCAPGQAPSIGHAGRDCQISGKPFAGRRFGVRAPTPDETPLSAEEVLIGMREGIL